MNLKKMTAALGFAHLLGLPAAAAARAEDDDKKKDPDADDGDDDESAARAEDDDSDDDKDEKKGKSAKAVKDEGDDDGDDEKKGGKKAAKADDDDDSDDDGKENAARKSERARCAAIFASPAAGTRPDMAAHLAFNTSMSSKAAVEMLGVVAAGGAPAARGLAGRMASVSIPNVGAGAPAGKATTGAGSVANMIVEAGKKRRGEA